MEQGLWELQYPRDWCKLRFTFPFVFEVASSWWRRKRPRRSKRESRRQRWWPKWDRSYKCSAHKCKDTQIAPDREWCFLWCPHPQRGDRSECSDMFCRQHKLNRDWCRKRLFLWRIQFWPNCTPRRRSQTSRLRCGRSPHSWTGECRWSPQSTEWVCCNSKTEAQCSWSSAQWPNCSVRCRCSNSLASVFPSWCPKLRERNCWCFGWKRCNRTRAHCWWKTSRSRVSKEADLLTPFDPCTLRFGYWNWLPSRSTHSTNIRTRRSWFHLGSSESKRWCWMTWRERAPAPDVQMQCADPSDSMSCFWLGKEWCSSCESNRMFWESPNKHRLWKCQLRNQYPTSLMAHRPSQERQLLPFRLWISLTCSFFILSDRNDTSSLPPTRWKSKGYFSSAQFMKYYTPFVVKDIYNAHKVWQKGSFEKEQQRNNILITFDFIGTRNIYELNSSKRVISKTE